LVLHRSGAAKVIAIGASLGGVAAIEHVLSGFMASVPPVVLVLHMQAGMAKLLADQLDVRLPLSVKQAASGDILKKGQVLIAPYGMHMKVIKHLGQVAVECFNGPKVQHALPSADVLFESVAEVFGADSVGVILTGVGADGARGLLKMRELGAATIGQDEDTCVVYGMSKAAKEMGAVAHELPIHKISSKILSFV